VSLGSAHRRGGFTLVEIAIVLAIVSILVRLAIPEVDEALTRARAAAAVGDVEVVRTAAAAYYARSNQWPEEAPAGIVPTGLEQDLPEGFSFDRGDYTLDWDRWTLPGEVPDSGAAAAPKTLLGISIATDDELLGNAVAGLMGPRGWYTLGNSATFLVEGI
jgi:prepilin-type N-terminal cleavage/methylation domain-containing protein